MLKLRPDSGITATAFETRNIGVALEVNATPAGDEFYDIMVTVSHTRLGGWYKHQAGRLPTGKMLMIEQPQFLASRNTGSMRLRSGERAVVGIHQPAGSKKMIDLFFLKLTAASTPAQK